MGYERRSGGENSYSRDRDREDEGFHSGNVKARLRAKARKKARKAKKKAFGQSKVCRYCADENVKVDYKDAKVLRVFVAETGKLIPARISGNCAKHQREVSLAVKRARHLALMPYMPPSS